VRDFWVP